MRLFFLLAVTAMLAGLSVLGVACEDDEGEEPLPTVAQDSPPAESPTAVLTQPEPVQPLDETVVTASAGVLEVTIENAQFVGNKLGLSPGEAANIDVTNRDTQVHNLRIAGFDGEYQTDDDAVTDPDPIEAGGSGSLQFAPAVPGQYTFRCDYHPGTMGGAVIVE
jgi:plastocyanin